MSNTDEEILEGDKIIAEFMGEKISQNGMIEFQSNGFGLGTKTLHKMEYHSSWDWLMPVVEKIEMLHWNDRNNQFNPQLEFFLQNEIEFVWNHVVKFLKWYNLNAVPVGSR